MGKIDSKFLDTNDKFPDLELQLVSGETLELPKHAGGGYAVFFTYRGHW